MADDLTDEIVIELKKCPHLLCSKSFVNNGTILNILNKRVHMQHCTFKSKPKPIWYFPVKLDVKPDDTALYLSKSTFSSFKEYLQLYLEKHPTTVVRSIAKVYGIGNWNR
jgi:hypothetical protein